MDAADIHKRERRHARSSQGDMHSSSQQQSNRHPEDDICWQSALGNPGDRLAASFRLSKLTDVTISFPGSQEVIRAHRFVLAISSPVFERMFYGPLAEGKELKLPEDPPDAFKWLIQYIYNGNTNLHYVSLAVKVYQLAKKYQMDALASLCSTYLQRNLTARNLPLILDTAMLHEDMKLQEYCSQVIAKSAEAVFNSPYLGQINRISMKHLLQHHFVVSSEVIIFKGLVNWAKTQIGSDVKEPGVSALRKVVEEYLPMIRFLTMSLDEFVKSVMPTNIVTPEECNAILMNIERLPDIPLPPVCCKKRKMRSECLPARKKKHMDSPRKNCLVSSPHSSLPNSPNSFTSRSPSHSPGGTPNSSCRYFNYLRLSRSRSRSRSVSHSSRSRSVSRSSRSRSGSGSSRSPSPRGSYHHSSASPHYESLPSDSS